MHAHDDKFVSIEKDLRDHPQRKIVRAALPDSWGKKNDLSLFLLLLFFYLVGIKEATLKLYFTGKRIVSCSVGITILTLFTNQF